MKFVHFISQRESEPYSIGLRMIEGMCYRDSYPRRPFLRAAVLFVMLPKQKKFLFYLWLFDCMRKDILISYPLEGN